MDRPSKIDQITFTRFIAALTVVIFHFGKQVPPFNIYPLDRIIPIGPIAVGYFFVLSGFILTYVYAQDDKKFNLPKYFLARFGRIYPVYLIALILTIPFKFNSTPYNDLMGFILSATLVQAWVPPYPLTFNGPGWSLSVEAFLYLIFPVILSILMLIKKNFGNLLIWVVWFFSLAVHTFILNTNYSGFPSLEHDILFYSPLFHMNSFMIGMYGGLYYKRNLVNIKVNQRKNLIFLLVVSLIIISLIMFRSEINKALGIVLATTNGLLAPIFLLFIILLALDDTWISKLLKSKGAVILGEASYSLYIFQNPIFDLYNNYVPRFIRLYLEVTPTQHFYIFLILYISFSVVVFKIIEHPTRKFIKGLFNSGIEIS